MTKIIRILWENFNKVLKTRRLFFFTYIKVHIKQSRAQRQHLEKGTSFNISKQARTLKFMRLSVFIRSTVDNISELHHFYV